MAVLEILLADDLRLRQRAARIARFDDRLRRIAADLHETMDDAPGVGLAGPQVGIMERIIVVHVPGDYIAEGAEDVRYTLLNPEITDAAGEATAAEGCLSIPGWTAEVPRYTTIKVRARDVDGRPIKLKAEDWVARVIQHEVDHLDGILFLDRVVDRSTIREIDDEPDEPAE